FRHEGPRPDARHARLGTVGPCDPEHAAARPEECRQYDGCDRAGHAEGQPGGGRMSLAIVADNTISAPEQTSPHASFVELEKVTHTYGRGERQVQALSETSLRIEKGDFVALVGPSGCGKSTILKLVTGLINASSGYVFVAGRQIGAEPVRVGMAFQN